MEEWWISPRECEADRSHLATTDGSRHEFVGSGRPRQVPRETTWDETFPFIRHVGIHTRFVRLVRKPTRECRRCPQSCSTLTSRCNRTDDTRNDSLPTQMISVDTIIARGGNERPIPSLQVQADLGTRETEVRHGDRCAGSSRCENRSQQATEKRELEFRSRTPSRGQAVRMWRYSLRIGRSPSTLAVDVARRHSDGRLFPSERHPHPELAMIELR